MRLKHVEIFSALTAKEAEQKINDAIVKYENSDIDVNYEIMIENSAFFGGVVDTRYTLIIHEFDPYIEDELEPDE